MLGSNSEKVLRVIDKIIQATSNINIDVVSYRLTSTLISDSVSGSTSNSGGDGGHSHGAGSLHVANPKSEEDPHEAFIDNISDLKPLKAELDSIIDKVQLIDKNIYVRNNQMHNSLGSPYTEMYRLQAILNETVTFSASCQYMGEYLLQVTKAAMLINRVLQLAIDTKWAIITYSDYLERGYNYVQGQNPDTTR